jgi:hypothetical protein
VAAVTLLGQQAHRALDVGEQGADRAALSQHYQPKFLPEVILKVDGGSASVDPYGSLVGGL